MTSSRKRSAPCGAQSRCTAITIAPLVVSRRTEDCWSARRFHLRSLEFTASFGGRAEAPSARRRAPERGRSPKRFALLPAGRLALHSSRRTPSARMRAYYPRHASRRLHHDDDATHQTSAAIEVLSPREALKVDTPPDVAGFDRTLHPDPEDGRMPVAQPERPRDAHGCERDPIAVDSPLKP